MAAPALHDLADAFALPLPVLRDKALLLAALNDDDEDAFLSDAYYSDGGRASATDEERDAFEDALVGAAMQAAVRGARARLCANVPAPLVVGPLRVACAARSARCARGRARARSAACGRACAAQRRSWRRGAGTRRRWRAFRTQRASFVARVLACMSACARRWPHRAAARALTVPFVRCRAGRG
jgi:hypothetical protein